MENSKTCYDATCFDKQPRLSWHEPVHRRRVCFNPTATIIDPPSTFLLPATRAERQHLWYQKKDVRAFTLRDRDLIEEYRTIVSKGGGDQGLSHLHVRGLDLKLTENTRNEVRSRQELVCGLVMEEQAKQRLDGVMDPSKLRTVSLIVSRPAQSTAYKLGLQDALEAAEDSRTVKWSNEYKAETAEISDAKKMLENQTDLNGYLMKTLHANGVSVGAAASPTSTMVNIEKDARVIIWGCVLTHSLWV